MLPTMKEWFEGAKMFCIPMEGYVTYGGMSGRDLNALAQGLDENTEFDMLQTRIHQVEYLAKSLTNTESLISVLLVATLSS